MTKLRIEALLSLPGFWLGAIEARRQLDLPGGLPAEILARLRDGVPLGMIPEYHKWRAQS